MRTRRCLLLAGSAYDLFGAHRLGLPTYWHDRVGMTPPPDAPTPMAHHRSLYPLLSMVATTAKQRQRGWRAGV